ncbi:MAG: 5'/3'-nucleotidase SurE [Desulfobulbaceae bacterium]|nr:5'/3'-nucleotidase SurE [Desulfobulbaceae bacterium]
MEKELNILVTNDDGINSPGLEVLARAASKFGKVAIFAPDRQQSAVSSALTINRPLKVQKYFKNKEFYGYAVDGTPADCVKMALTTLLDFKPDLILSGINHGKNTSINVMYSGTVAAAVEGVMAGINSIAFSITSHSLYVEMKAAEEYAVKIIESVVSRSWDTKILLNVNIPAIEAGSIKGIRVTKLAKSYWNDWFERREDPFGNEYFWFAGDYITSDHDKETDDTAIEDDFVSVTPLKFLFDDVDTIKKIKFVESLR